MRAYRLALVLAALVLVQVGFIAAVRPLGVVPNVLLVLVVLVGLMGTASGALLVALVGGLTLDLTSGADFGLRLGLLVLLALATSLVHRAGFQVTGPGVGLVLVAVGTVVADAAILGGLVGAVGYWPIGQILGNATLEIVLNLGVMLALRPVVSWAVTPPGAPAIG